MGVVGELEGEGVFSGSQFNLGLGLALTEVNVFLVGGNRSAGFHGRAVNNDVMVTGIGNVLAGGVDGHSFHSHFYFDGALDGGAVFQVGKKDFLLGACRFATGCGGLGGGFAGGRCCGLARGRGRSGGGGRRVAADQKQREEKG